MGGHVLGIVGVGHLGEAMARGFAGQSQSLRLALSPRSRERTQRLAQLDGVSVCADTQEVLDTTEVVVLALPRSSIVATCQTQRFAPGQLVISVAAGVKHAQLLSALGPATLVRAMPVTAAACNASPTCLYPHDERAAKILAYLGPVHGFDDEAQFEAAATIAVYYGWLFALMGQTTSWLGDQGVPHGVATALVAEMTGAAARTVQTGGDDPQSLADEIAPPGSFTRAGLEHLAKSHALEAWVGACETVLERARENSP